MKRLKIHFVVVRKYNHKTNNGQVTEDKENILNRNSSTLWYWLGRQYTSGVFESYMEKYKFIHSFSIK